MNAHEAAKEISDRLDVLKKYIKEALLIRRHNMTFSGFYRKDMGEALIHLAELKLF